MKDLASATIPMNVGNMGDKPEIKAVPWRFFPLLNQFWSKSHHKKYGCRLFAVPELYGHGWGLGSHSEDSTFNDFTLYKTAQYTALVGYNEARQQPNPQNTMEV